MKSRRPPNARASLQKRAGQGFRGYPLATVAYYGPDDQFASKVAVGIVVSDDEMKTLKRWFTETVDVRLDNKINREITRFIKNHKVRSVAITDGIIGCPHEEGKDYPLGEVCPECPFWANRDRWTGKLLH
jgi:hypothetical protein